MKLLVTVLIAINAVLWVWYVEKDVRDMKHREFTRLMFKAQNELFVTHAEAINDQTRFLINLTKGDG